MADVASEQFYSTISELPDVKPNYSNEATGNDSDNQSFCSGDGDDASHTSSVMITDQVKLGELTGTQEIRIQLKVNETIVRYVCFLLLFLFFSSSMFESGPSK